jgi:general secretion pathway protein A
LAVAGGSAVVTFAPKALDRVHQLSSGIPRLINLLCDRALLAAFSLRTNRVLPDMVDHAAKSLDVQPVVSVRRRTRSVAGSLWNGRVSLAAAAAVMLLSSLLGVGMTAIVYQRITAPVEAKTLAFQTPPSSPVGVLSDTLRGRALPSNAAFTIMFGAYPAESSGVEQVRALTAWLENAGLPVYYAELDRGVGGRWYRVMAGSYTDDQSAARDLERLKAAAPSLDARVTATSADGGSP